MAYVSLKPRHKLRTPVTQAHFLYYIQEEYRWHRDALNVYLLSVDEQESQSLSCPLDPALW